MFVKDGSTEINQLADVSDYDVEFDEESGNLIVKKDDKVICKKNHKNEYWNVDYGRGFKIK